MNTPFDAKPQNDSLSVVTNDREACPKHWYIAQVRMKCEKSTARKIADTGIETFIATQQETHCWSDRKKVVEKVLIPMVVFFKADPESAKEVERLSCVYSLMRAPGQKAPAIIPDTQIDSLRFMLGCSDVPVCFDTLVANVGDRVRVFRGKLRGLEGMITDISSSRPRVSIVIDYIGCASVTIDKSDLEIIKA